ncbi:MAG TPA: VWA domain-containing protein [Candidatus Binatia bacterium]|nr:VWA domain-containing protein [Candidatus Binatia bacterium]
MAPSPAPRHRFSAWDGTQDPLGPDLEELFDRLSEDVFHGWDFETALRRLLSQGWHDRRGRHLMGMEEMLEQLGRRRQAQLERFNLNSVFQDMREKLDRVISQERRGIQERLDQAPDEARPLLERVAKQRRGQLDALPPDPGGAIRKLRDYEFMDPQAEAAFQRLLDEIRKQVVDAHFKEMTQAMRAMTGEEMAQLRAMAKDLNALLRQKLEGVPPAQRQRSYESFLQRWGRMFPNAPASVDEFIEQLMRQMARMDSLLQSLSPEMRRELQSVIESVFDDPELQATLADLAGTLDLLSPRSRLGSRYGFFGDEEVSLEEAMGLMDGLQSMEELERKLRGIGRGEAMDPEARGLLDQLLGGEAAQSLDEMQRLVQELEGRGLVERSAEGMQLTARGMRKIGQKALGDLFARLSRDRFGEHDLLRLGVGGDRGDDSKGYEFGDPFDLDVQRTIMNAVTREAQGDRELEAPPPAGRTGPPPQGREPEGPEPGADIPVRGRRVPRLDAGDFEVHRTESMTRCATVLMLDMSRSMPLRGYFYAAKKVALALDSLIRSQYPRDALTVVGFSDLAREIPSRALPQLSVNEYVYGTNLQHALMLARRILGRSHAENKQVIIVSDGEPTAHIENGRPVFYYPPLPETFAKTLVEVRRCTLENIVINTFMLESNHHLVRFVNQMTRLNRGRAFFISPDRLGDYVLVDYVKSRRASAA